jgi:hypothetical protein
VERCPREELTALFAQRPARDDALLAHRRDLFHVSREAAEHGLAAGREADCEGAGTVERGPHELGRKPAVDSQRGVRDPRRRDQPVPQRAGEDAQAVSAGTFGAADEAGRKGVPLEAGVAGGGPLGVLERRRLGDVELHVRRLGLGHARLAVPDDDAAILAINGERTPQRRRQPQGDLGVAGVEKRGEETARVAAVRRPRRAVEARIDDQFTHDRYTTF